MNVVSIPNYDCNKLRCCEYLPVGLTEWEGGSIKEGEEMVLDSFMEEYSLQDLKENLPEGITDTDVTSFVSELTGIQLTDNVNNIEFRNF